MPSIADFTKSMLALVMWCEDGPDGLQGMTAAGLVIRNRVNAGWHGGQWCAVMEAHGQYAADTPPLRWPDTRNPAFQAVLRVADSIYEGTEPDITGGALHYANLNQITRQWFRENVMAQQDAHRRIGSVGAQTFFA